MRKLMRQVRQRKAVQAVQKDAGRGLAPLELEVVEQAHLDRVPCGFNGVRRLGGDRLRCPLFATDTTGAVCRKVYKSRFNKGAA